jgi:hypothetical protein
MEFKGLIVGDLLVMNGTLYRVTGLLSLPSGYQVQITSFTRPPIDIILTGKDYGQLIAVNSLYYLGNIVENEALMLLYS